MFQCYLCGELFHHFHEICPFCSSEAMVWIQEEDKEWAVKSPHFKTFVIQLSHAETI